MSARADPIRSGRRGLLSILGDMRVTAQMGSCQALHLREDGVVERERDGLLVRLGRLEHVARGAHQRPLLEQVRAGEQTLVLVVEEDDVHALVADVLVHHTERLHARTQAERHWRVIVKLVVLSVVRDRETRRNAQKE